MSDNFDQKKQRVKLLNERQKQILNVLIDDPKFNLVQTAKDFNLDEGYVRSILSSIFRDLGVPEGTKDKREYVIREYKEAYKEACLIVIEVSKTPTESTITKSVPKRKINTKVVIWVLAILLLLSLFFNISMIAVYW